MLRTSRSRFCRGAFVRGGRCYVSACIFLSCHFKKKIQARGEKIQAKYGQLLIIRELCGSLYLFYCAIQADFIKKIQARGGQWGKNKGKKKGEKGEKQGEK